MAGKQMKSISVASDFSEQEEAFGAAAAASRSWVQRPMFWRPSYLAPSAWHEHIPFAFWLMQAHRPRVVVELGVHYGVSYFAFCQAVSRLGMDASCYGIDTFKGDMHSGEYDGSVYEQVRKQNDAHYAAFSTILRSTFEDALSYFQNGSIDLLHIDGMHTFDAVRMDFESWLPKLSPRAVVLLHDTNVRERGFGVARMFRDLCELYPHFEFIHGHGLGILGIGKQQSKQLKQLFSLSANESERQTVREAFSILGQGCADAFQSERNKEKAAAWMEQSESRDKQIKVFQQCLEKAKSEIEQLNGKLAEQANTAHAEREKLAHEKGNLEGRLELLDSIRLQLMDELVQRQSRLNEAHVSLETRLLETEAANKARQECETRSRQLESELENADLQVKAALQEKEILELAAKHLHEEQEKLRLSHDSLEQSNRDLSATIVLFQSENSKLKMELADRAMQMAEGARIAEEAEARSSMLTREICAANERLGQLEQQLSHEKTVAAQLSADRAAAEKRAMDAESENAVRMEQARRETNARIENLTAENNNLRRGLEDARIQLGGLRRELDSMAKRPDASAEIAAMNQKHAEQMKKIAEELQAHKKQLGERFAELAEMTKMLEEQSGALKERDDQVQALEAGMEELKESYAQALEEINANKAEIQAKTSSLEDRFREIAMLTQVVQQREAELHSKNEELNLEKERAAHFRDLLEVQTNAAGQAETAPEAQPEAVQQRTRKGRPRVSRLSIDAQISLLDKSEILNKDWYLEQYEDVARSGMNPAEHYVRYGAAEGRQPGPDFDTSWYVTNYPDVAETGVNPAVHYLKYGKKEGRATYSIRRG